ncbi:hypothetical protein MMC28_002652 [Mycoblastus sanguinarius]|nr:hypothetical protein [Mycoblastus sanguinarius]
MAPNFFSNSSRETSSVKYFEIRLDKSNLILRGTEYEASSVVLKGTLVLCLSEPLRIQGIRLRFTGEKRLGWYQTGGSGGNLVKQDEEFLRNTWDFMTNNGKRSAETLPAGNYEYPFDMILPGSTPESVEGLQDSWVIYRMKATIERGILQQNSVARKQVRVIRTLDTAALELAHAMSVENVWPDKIDYSLSTPTKAVIFGTNVQVDFRLIPLLKGLKIGKITTELNEKQEMIIRSPRSSNKSRQMTRPVTKDEYHLPDDVESEDIEGQEGYVFSRIISIPQSLKKCVQTVEALGIKIRHNLSFNVQMHNPDGHISELHATLPLHIFISPNIPIDDNNNLVNQGPRNISTTTAMDDLTPPQYGEHQFDQLYSDIDPSGYMTPAGGASGMGTPFQSRSRSVSAENLASMDGIAYNDFAASVLQTRLSNLDVVRSNRIARDRAARDPSQLSTLCDGTAEQSSPETMRTDDGPAPSISLPNGDYFEHSGGNTSGTVSRRVSEEDEPPSGPVTPQHIEYSAESLAKVPSYTTAIQSQARMPINDGLPTYQTATRLRTHSPPMRQPPTQAHVHRVSGGV